MCAQTKHNSSAGAKTRAAAGASDRGPGAFEGNPDFVLSLARGLQVLEAFEGQRNGLTAADIASRTGLSRAAVRRLLMTLEMLGYAQHHGSVFRLKPSILRLGFSFLSSDSLPATAQPLLESVTEKIHESCSLSVLDNDQIVYLARSAGSRVMSVNLSVGTRLPAYCTSMGRVLLAGLKETEFSAYLKRTSLKRLTPKTVTGQSTLRKIIEGVRRDGYALVNEELEIGLRSIAVPVKNSAGRVVAAMNTGVHASRISVEQMLQQFLPVLREHSSLLTHLAG
jgi:IclR family pca regulon transcriptional regulator